MSNFEVLNKERFEEVYKLGVEFSCEGLEPDKFKAKSESEMKAFLKGYKEGLELQKKETTKKGESLAM